MRHPFRRCHIVPPQQFSRQVLTAVAAHPEKSLVGIGDAAVGFEENDTDRLDLDHPPQPLFALFERLLGLLARGDVLEKHRDPVRRRVGATRDPHADDGRDGLETRGHALLKGAPDSSVLLRADHLGELLPDVLPQQFVSTPRPELFRLLIDVGETPLSVDSEEGVADALQYDGELPPHLPLPDKGTIRLCRMLELLVFHQNYAPRYAPSRAIVMHLRGGRIAMLPPVRDRGAFGRRKHSAAYGCAQPGWDRTAEGAGCRIRGGDPGLLGRVETLAGRLPRASGRRVLVLYSRRMPEAIRAAALL